MELRHLRYFIAVAEEGSLTVAAKRRLHTSQPSLSRQIRDLEYQVGAQLLVRSARGIELTHAGRAFLDHARLALAQVDAARDAARRAARPFKPVFAVGFLSGEEVMWLAEASRVLASDLQSIEMAVSSELSPDLAEGLATGRLDIAFMRAEPNRPDLEYITVAREPFVVVMPSDHPLTAHKKVDVRELANEIFIGGSDVAGPMRRAIEMYLAQNDLDIEPAYRVHNLTMALSLIASTRGVALLPAYAENFLPWSVTSRPLKGEAPTIELVVGYNRTNRSPTLELFLSRIDQIRK
ncbi:LysR family transcriptional regulator [Paraburkholderia dinghuensis]|uniref:LysR family transcriptional regulator n=1 Tax=Paraburkholderia dinghuensis TaxID=2305225 RepID=A0A3N6MTG4_9BURK|nr:LysR family transcriptional regulator [Paraburkholderia dinghuensis]RQH07088.1 LysR family transcriptional regulator [Paraburkholderia dinghuensis]